MDVTGDNAYPYRAPDYIPSLFLWVHCAQSFVIAVWSILRVKVF